MVRVRRYALLALAALLAACLRAPPVRPAGADLADLRAAFEAARDQPRLILLLSPT